MVPLQNVADFFYLFWTARALVFKNRGCKVISLSEYNEVLQVLNISANLFETVSRILDSRFKNMIMLCYVMLCYVMLCYVIQLCPKVINCYTIMFLITDIKLLDNRFCNKFNVMNNSI